VATKVSTGRKTGCDKKEIHYFIAVQNYIRGDQKRSYYTIRRGGSTDGVQENLLSQLI
jgi:hypothetical protein